MLHSKCVMVDPDIFVGVGVAVIVRYIIMCAVVESVSFLTLLLLAVYLFVLRCCMSSCGVVAVAR
jgi:hypothetical protein